MMTTRGARGRPNATMGFAVAVAVTVLLWPAAAPVQAGLLPGPPEAEVLAPDHSSRKPDLVVVGEEVRLQGRASDDGTIVSAVFEKDGEGSTSVAATNVEDDLWQTARVSYATTGEKTLILTVEDDDANVVTAERTIEVVDPRPPVVRFAEDTVVVDDPDPAVTVDGGPSFDALGRPLTFRYVFPDGQVTTFGDTPVWRVPPAGWEPPAAGSFDVTLVVTNDLGLNDTETATVLVDDALAVQAQATPATPGMGDQVNVSGTVVDESGAPVAGATVQVQVRHGLLPAGSARTGSTGPDGTFEFQMPFDMVAGPVGFNLLGQHEVVVTASVTNAFDFEEEPGPLETARTSFTYFVPLL